MTNVPASKLVIDFDKPGSPLKPDEKRCPIFNILCKKVMIFNTLKNVVALQTLIFRIFMRPLVGGLKRIQTTVLRRFRAGGAIGIAL